MYFININLILLYVIITIMYRQIFKFCLGQTGGMGGGMGGGCAEKIRGGT